MKNYRYQSKSELRVQVNGWKIIAGVLAAMHLVAFINQFWKGGAL